MNIMFWVLMIERSDEYELSIDALPSDVERLDLYFDLGNAITANIGTINVPYELHPQEYITDNIIAPTRLGLLINNKVKAVFDALDIKNIQYFNTQLLGKNNQSKNQEYYIANVVGKHACVDKGASKLVFFDDGDIEFINKLVLTMNSQNDYEHIFRLAEFPSILIISDILKTALLKNHITGFKIYKPESFSL